MVETSAGRRVARVLSRWANLLFFELCAIVYLPTTGTKQLQTDAYAASLESWRIATSHRPWLDHFDPFWITRYIPRHYVFSWVAHNPDGHLVVYRSPGAVVASIPAYLIRGGGTNSFGYSPLPSNITAALLTALAMTMMFALLRRHLDLRMALLAAGTLAFATPMWSVSANWILTHPVTVFGIAGMAWASDRNRWWLVGVFGGIGLWGRLHVAVIVAILGLGVALWRRDWRIAVKVAVPSFVLLALASWWSHWLYDSWFPSGGYGTTAASSLLTGNTGRSPTIGHGVIAKIANQLGLWVAPDRGILIWTPLIVLMLPALVRSWRTLPDWSRALLVAGLVYALIQGQLDAFTGGDGFWGYRLMLETLACAFPALALSVRSAGRIALSLAPYTVGLMFAAIGTGALDPLRNSGGLVTGWWLPEHDAWKNNAFVNMLGHGQPSAWMFLVSGLLVGLLGARVRKRRPVEDPLLVEDLGSVGSTLN